MLKKFFNICSLVLCYTLFMSNIVQADTIYETSKKFDYSFTEDEDWLHLSRDERIESCQIPEDIVDSMSTETLLESVLDYPFMIDMLAFNTYEEGYERVKSEFPALQELIERDNLSSALIDEYYQLSSSKSKNIDENIVKIGYITILTNQDEVEDNIDFKVLEELDELFKKDNLYLYESLQDEKNLKAGGPTTPNGNSVAAINNSSIADFTTSQKEAYNKQVTSTYNVTVVSNPTKKYNCHSYAWYSQSTSNYYWINDPSKYMTDGSYKKTTGTIKSGNKVYWVNGSHSGIISYVGTSGIGNVKAKSKWGQLGVYNHYLDDCPYTGSVSTWTR